MTHGPTLLPAVAKLVFLLCSIAFTSSSTSAQVWTVLTADPKGDAADESLADAAQLSYRYDKGQDLIWFRVTMYGEPNQQAFGVNIVVDTGSDEKAKVSWWGANKAFKLDKLITVWVTRHGDGYQGTIGVGDTSGVKQKQFNNLSQNNLTIRIESDSVVIGVKRTDITNQLKMNLIAAVGSNERWNDDMPNMGSATLDLTAERPKRGLREIDLSRNNLVLSADYQILPQEQAPLIKKYGHGKQAVILVPGMYSGTDSFADFITQNRSRYRMYVLTPPGLNGTPARPWPDPRTRLSELTWTRLLERDIVNLIHREKLTKPVIIAERQPASVAAVAVANTHSEEIGGIILIGTNLLQFFPSPKDPTRQTPATFAERVATVEDGFAAKWFKYVTPETWLSNNYQPEWYSSNSTKGQKAWQESEAVPLPVKIRYTCEFWLSNITEDFKKLQVPTLVLLPAFDEKFLAESTNSFVKTAFVDAWDPKVITQPWTEIVRIPGARLLTLHDAPEIANNAIAHFIQRVSNNPIDRWAKAVGGRERVAAVKTIYREASIEFGNYKGSLKIWHTSDGKYRKEEQIATYSLIETFDGENGFVKQGNNVPHKMAAAELALATSKRFANANAMFFAFFPERHRGRRDVESDDLIVLKPEGGVEWRVRLDPQTSLPANMVHNEGEQTITVTFDSYETLEGIKLVKELHRTTDGRPGRAVIRFTKTVINQPVEASLFSLSQE